MKAQLRFGFCAGLVVCSFWNLKGDLPWDF